MFKIIKQKLKLENFLNHENNSYIDVDPHT